MTSPAIRPTLFLDIDDVLCVNKCYGVTHVHWAAYHSTGTPADLYEKLFESKAVIALNMLLREFEPRIVMTTSWLAILQRHHFVDLFNRSGLELIARNLHQHWDAASGEGKSRLEAIEKWLEHHHRGEPILVLDDTQSGESIIDSLYVETGRAILCEVNVGFHQGLLDQARNALRRPYFPREPWRR